MSTRRTVVVTVSSWGSGQYKVTCDGGKRPIHKYTSQTDPAHAAAEAMNLARPYAEYAIFAPQSVLAFIPEHLRTKGGSHGSR